MPDEVQAAAPATTTQTTEQQKPSGQAEPQKQQLDTQSYAELNKEIGRKAILKDLKARFGTDDLDEIEKLMKKAPAKAEADEATAKRLAEIEAENATLKAKTADIEYTQKIKDAIMPHAPKDIFINSIVRDFMADYELKTHKGVEYVFKKGSDTVEMVGQQLATLPLFFADRAKNPDYAGQFKSAAAPSSPGHITPGAIPADGLTGEIIVTDAQQKDAAFMQAVKESGQQGKFISTGKVDYDKLKDHLKK